MLKTERADKNQAIWQAAVFAVSFGGGFFLSGENITQVLPFGNISLAAASGLIPSAAVLTGSLLCCIAQGTVGSGIVNLSAIMACVIYKVFFEERQTPKKCGISASLAAAAASLLVAAVLGELAEKLILCIVYGAVCGGLTYCISVCLECISEGRGIDLSGIKGFCFGAVYAVLAGVLSAAGIPLINAGIILGGAVTAAGAYFCGCSGGAICGALAMCGVFMSGQGGVITAAALPAAGIIAGALSRRRAVRTALIFSLSSVIFAAAAGDRSGTAAELAVQTAVNTAVSAGIFLLAASRLSDRYICTNSGENAESMAAIKSQMSFMAGSVETVRRESLKIAQVLSAGAVKEEKRENEGCEVCRRCSRRLECWYNRRDTTKKAFSRLGRLSPSEAGKSFPKELDHCMYKAEIIAGLEERAREKMSEKLLTMRLADSRRLVFEQMRAIGDIIADAGSITDMRSSVGLSREISSQLEKYGFAPERVIAGYNSANRMLAELYYDSDRSPKNPERLCDIISGCTGLRLECTAPVCSGSVTRIRIYETPPFSFETYKASMCAQDSAETGDSYAVFGDGTGTAYAVLSDGMGSGRGAALESRIVVSIFRRLISSGVGYDTAIRMINPIMLTKSGNEAFATLDAVRIDPDKSRVTVIKSGAAATLIRHKGQVMKINSPTLPIGIVEEANIYSKDFDFDEGDIIIMFSDGISENEYMFIKELLLGSDNIKFIVDEICAKAELFSPTVRSDDITVIGIRKTRRNI